MNPALNSFIAVLLSLGFSCQQIPKGTLNYNQLSFDTNTICIFAWDTTKYVFPKNSDPWPLRQADLSLIDSLLADAIDSFNRKMSPAHFESFNKIVPIDSFIIKPAEYKYQLFPYKDVNGQHIVSIIGFKDDFKSWKTQTFSGKIHSGMHELLLKINLSDRKRDDLQTGGFG
jgi:hypothetical protein